MKFISFLISKMIPIYFMIFILSTTYVSSMEIFIIEGETLTYDTEGDDVAEEIEMQHVEELRLILEENPNIRLLKLESGGGSKLGHKEWQALL